uniref:LRR-RLK n=1 Tax=Rhizophora mucronata TaxID=61149 RepID=A0A2P2MWM2_RHIMU
MREFFVGKLKLHLIVLLMERRLWFGRQHQNSLQNSYYRTNLDINIKNTPPKTLPHFTILESKFCKLKCYSVVSILKP